ncbi:hypothetical protein LR48_Vigan03g084400 [Vigna angularis]|uniref:Uncharacterized protein n=1 Tax=Phaseolus angularis TaxID=3914 RepID=A0A0L9U476_PHAAN|nr:hypothetical protein LR48_Vigan03g084400 [Vigna angularis]
MQRIIRIGKNWQAQDAEDARSATNGRSSSEQWTLVQRDQQVDARPARGRTLAQRGRSSSEQRTLVKRVLARDQQVDARPARGRSSTSEDARPASSGRSSSEDAKVDARPASARAQRKMTLAQRACTSRPATRPCSPSEKSLTTYLFKNANQR